MPALNDFTGHGELPKGHFSDVVGARLVSPSKATKLWDVTVSWHGGASLELCVEAKTRADAENLCIQMLTAVPDSVRIKRSK